MTLKTCGSKDEWWRKCLPPGALAWGKSATPRLTIAAIEFALDSFTKENKNLESLWLLPAGKWEGHTGLLCFQAHACNHLV